MLDEFSVPDTNVAAYLGYSPSDFRAMLVRCQENMQRMIGTVPRLADDGVSYQLTEGQAMWITFHGLDT